MTLSVTCSYCGARLRAPDNAAGRTLNCPKCRKRVTVTAITQQPTQPPIKVETIVLPTKASDRPSSLLMLVSLGIVGALLLAFGLTVGLVVYFSVKPTEQVENKEVASGSRAERNEPSRLLDERGQDHKAPDRRQHVDETPAVIPPPARPNRTTPPPPRSAVVPSPSRPSPAIPPPPRKERVDRPAKPSWTLADKVVRLGDLKVQITETTIGKVQLKDIFREDATSKEDFLIVKLELRNLNPTKKVEYRSWAGEDFSLGHDHAALIDNFNNRYKRIGFGLGSYPVGAVKGSESLYPNKSVTDVLVFELPLDRATYLELELPASNYGCEGMIRFRIPKYMYDEKAKAEHEETVRQQKVEEQREEDERRRAAAEEARRQNEARAEEAKRQEEAWIKQSVEQNCAALKDPDLKTRTQAAVELGRIGPRAATAVPDLRKALDDENEQLGKAATDALAKIGKPAVPALIETLANGTPRSRMNAAYALVSIDHDAKDWVEASDATVRKLQELFRNTDEAVLLGAVLDALAIVGGLERSMVDQLLTKKGLQHADAAVRAKALDCIRRVRLETLRIGTLASLNLEDPSWEVRDTAAKVLGVRMEHLSEADMKDIRALLAMTGKPKAVQIGLEAAKHLGPKAKEALPELLKLFQAAEGKIKLELALLLTGIDTKDKKVADAVGPILVGALRPKTKDDTPSEAVLDAIAVIGEPMVRQIFKALEAADDIGAINADHRKALFLALQHLGRKAYSEENVRIIREYQRKERYRDVQAAAGKALHAMLPPKN